MAPSLLKNLRFVSLVFEVSNRQIEPGKFPSGIPRGLGTDLKVVYSIELSPTTKE